MEGYLSQLVSRNAPAGPDLLQPALITAPLAGGNMEETFVEESAGKIASPNFMRETEQKYMEPGFDIESRPVIQQKNIHHQYLQQYFTRIVSEKDEQVFFDQFSARKNDKVDSAGEEKPTILNSKDANDGVAQEEIQIKSVYEGDPEKFLTPVPPKPLPSANPEPMPILVPATWLSPPASAKAPANSQTPSPIKPTPSLIIGKILIELLTAKDAPPRIINRTSPFQATGSNSSSGTLAFGLGQL